ncbi:hypothetical protein PR202_ga01885 [Eleusine coracana subsp. coracana]|uniref:DUF1618 domain-containing protein n=1 Tax=Eleusine coracana subsp. coracana TaxID=191504 RepID=A0AAV5BG91_ELECO|nr:hypothetical protein PR202_ga01198 [Eleusine coracana subsp. coracana]GJM86067.1 hypothetical protein PR202_ga01885 [Eleusine coracana subsp. coracana]
MTLPVRDPVRETLTPVPKDVLEEMLYHDTRKAVAVGGARGTVVWADLWRGLIVCDSVLDEQPELRDVPLPLPERSNRRYLFRKGPPDLLRDVAVSRHKDCIKYVEVELERRGGGGDSGRWKKARWWRRLHQVRWGCSRCEEQGTAIGRCLKKITAGLREALKLADNEELKSTEKEAA